MCNCNICNINHGAPAYWSKMDSNMQYNIICYPKIENDVHTVDPKETML